MNTGYEREILFKPKGKIFFWLLWDSFVEFIPLLLTFCLISILRLNLLKRNSKKKDLISPVLPKVEKNLTNALKKAVAHKNKKKKKFEESYKKVKRHL